MEPCKCVLPVGEKELLIPSPVEFRILIMNGSQSGNEICQAAVKFFLVCDGDARPERVIARLCPPAFNPPVSSLLDGRNSGKREQECVDGI